MFCMMRILVFCEGFSRLRRACAGCRHGWDGSVAPLPALPDRLRHKLLQRPRSEEGHGVVPAVVPGPPVPGSFPGRLGLPDLAASRLSIKGPGKPWLSRFGVGEFGDAEEVEELVVGERGGRFGRPLALLQCPEGGGGEAGETFPEGSWRSTGRSPWGRSGVPDDPVEVVGVETVEVGT